MAGSLYYQYYYFNEQMTIYLIALHLLNNITILYFY